MGVAGAHRTGLPFSAGRLWSAGRGPSSSAAGGREQRVDAGLVAARNLLGHEEPFRFVPFFWSQHYDVPINYAGAGPWDEVEIIGDPMKRDVLAVYRRKGRVVALASIYRDIESLRFEDLLERGDEAGIEALLKAARG